MNVYADKPTRIRVVDLETTGTTTDDAVVEIAAVDLIGSDIVVVGSDLIRPSIPIPPQASAVHHLMDEDVAHCRPIEQHLPHYMDQSRVAGVEIFASHNWRFEAQWLGDLLDGRLAICTLKCSIRVWPDAPAHNNQALRYWLRPKGLSSQIANCAHRAFPDAYVTAFILRELLAVASVDELITWTNEPVLLPKVTFGKHRGADWSDVPIDYLAWVADKSDLSGDIKFTADYYRRIRQQQAA
jgi:exodeoxyribonuclease X